MYRRACEHLGVASWPCFVDRAREIQPIPISLCWWEECSPSWSINSVWYRYIYCWFEGQCACKTRNKPPWPAYWLVFVWSALYRKRLRAVLKEAFGLTTWPLGIFLKHNFALNNHSRFYSCSRFSSINLWQVAVPAWVRIWPKLNSSSSLLTSFSNSPSRSRRVNRFHHRRESLDWCSVLVPTKSARSEMFRAREERVLCPIRVMVSLTFCKNKMNISDLSWLLF